MNEEKKRLEEARLGLQPWRKWGPYLSERQWATVREDYSAGGDAWAYFPHEQARSRAYRWGEDGIAGVSDERQRLCLALAMWNGCDPILKERLFGLTNSEGNHGEDVKEIYYYLDATPTHSYLKMLYKYPQAEFPYARLLEENGKRGREQPEFELLDTGIFDDDRYFDVYVEYAKAGPDDLLMQVTVHNRGAEKAVIHLLPQLWFRNTWSWKGEASKPSLTAAAPGAVEVRHLGLGLYTFDADGEVALLFCHNETNVARLYGVNGVKAYCKDAFHDYVVQGNHGAVNPQRTGTKAAAHYVLEVPAHASTRVRLRLAAGRAADPFGRFDEMMSQRRAEANAFYADLQAGIAGEDARNVQRQAFAGMIWSKQFYYFDVAEWLKGDPAQPAPPPERRTGRNSEWRHLNNADVISMPDKWEYPWYAAWDLAFHTIPFALIDPEFAKAQLVLLTREWYMHPNGQLPAYEWVFDEVNPPVHAWAAWRVFKIDRKQRGDSGDLAFLERIFHKMLLTFTWWVNRKDAAGRNVFQGGFLGLDNIAVFNRSMQLPAGVVLDQADGTAWMAMFSLNMLRIALDLAMHNPVYEDIATKFLEHFLTIAEAMTSMGGTDSGVGLWHEGDGFYYDHLNIHDRELAAHFGVRDGTIVPLAVRSIVGLIPMFAVVTLEPECMQRLKHFGRRLDWFLAHRPELARLVSRWTEPGRGERRLLSLLRGHRLKCLLRRMLDENEFLSPFGVRSLSRYHRDHPYTLRVADNDQRVSYVPGESDSGMFGGNSNWRGPVWMPINYLLIESLQQFHHYYGDDFKVECPTGSGRFLTINEVAIELTRRLTRIFLQDENGKRPVLAYHDKLHGDPHFKDWLLYHEYFHGDSGRGAGASHQSGWTGLIAKLLHPRRPAAGGGDHQRTSA